VEQPHPYPRTPAEQRAAILRQTPPHPWLNLTSASITRTPAEQRNDALRAATERFLSEAAPWEWFVSLTFARDVSDNTALRAFREWRRGAACDVYRSHTRIGWVYAPQRSTRLHFHALLAGIDTDDAARTAAERSTRLAGTWRNGSVDVLPVHEATGAAEYMLNHTDLSAADIRRGWDLDVACDRRPRCRRTRCRFAFALGPQST
jgi:hypothetical protein